jgi:membrane protease YdiL (CAAX protease family)
MKRHRLGAFFLLTFALSWGVSGLALLLSNVLHFEASMALYSPLYYLYAWSPAISALLVITITQGWAGLSAYLRRLTQWGAGIQWYGLVFLGVPLLNFLAALATQLAGQPALIVPTVALGAFAADALLRASAGPMEELGWRGYALPLLQRRLSGWQSALVLGAIWGVWHFPPLLFGVLPQIGEGSIALILVRFVVGTIAETVIYVVMMNATRGSILLAFLFHWMTNFPYPWEGEADIGTAQVLLFAALALALVGLLGGRYLGRQNLYTNPTPGAPEPHLGSHEHGEEKRQ